MRETRDVHTRLMRIALACDESQLYWSHARPGTPAASLIATAFEERWFGSRSMARVTYVMNTFADRFDAFPSALATLHRWHPADPLTRQNICHWHVQLSDPLYRAFTSDLLPRRRAHPEPTVDRDVVLRWIDQRVPGRWNGASSIRVANGLLTCAAEAGLCDANPGSRSLKVPRVSDEALGYLLYLLRNVEFEGTLLENPYLASLGLTDERLEQRLNRTPGIEYHRMRHLRDLKFTYPSLEGWLDHHLSDDRLGDRLHRPGSGDFIVDGAAQAAAQTEVPT